jgi:hypothetical protein
MAHLSSNIEIAKSKKRPSAHDSARAHPRQQPRPNVVRAWRALFALAAVSTTCKSNSLRNSLNNVTNYSKHQNEDELCLFRFYYHKGTKQLLRLL